MTSPIIWITDSPGWGGSEINLLRVLSFLSNYENLVIHGEQISDELSAGLDQLSVPRIVVPTGNRVARILSVAIGAFRLSRRYRNAVFVLWGHHSDTYRWGAVTFACIGCRYSVVEQLVPHCREAFAKSRLSVPLKRWTARRAVSVILNAKTQLGHYGKVFGFHGKNVHAIPNSRPIQRISKTVAKLRKDIINLRLRLGITGDRVVLCLARLNGQKDQTSLLRACLGVSAPMTVVLVGDGPDRQDLEKLSRTIAPHQVVFAGHQIDPLPWLAAADVFVLPSLAEGLPGALIEALAAALPCVVTAIPGNLDLIIDGETGLLVPMQSPESIAIALNRLHDDPDLAGRLGSAGFDNVASCYDEAAERRAWQQMVDELCNPKR